MNITYLQYFVRRTAHVIFIECEHAGVTSAGNLTPKQSVSNVVFRPPNSSNLYLLFSLLLSRVQGL